VAVSLASKGTKTSPCSELRPEPCLCGLQNVTFTPCNCENNEILPSQYQRGRFSGTTDSNRSFGEPQIEGHERAVNVSCLGEKKNLEPRVFLRSAQVFEDMALRDRGLRVAGRRPCMCQSVRTFRGTSGRATSDRRRNRNANHCSPILLLLYSLSMHSIYWSATSGGEK